MTTDRPTSSSGTTTSGARPAGYPADYEHRVVLQDGRAVLVRPVVPGDVAELAAAVRRADPETLRRRFLGAAGPRTAAQLRRLVDVDDVHRFAVAAFDDAGTGVGIARYEGATTWPAVELAVVVDPGWRHVGLATALLRDVLRRALDQGAHSGLVDFFADNVPVAALLEESGLPQQRHTAHGVVEDEVQLDGPPGVLRRARRTGGDVP
jgi:GNAT superfamily N-acetyltransferase